MHDTQPCSVVNVHFATRLPKEDGVISGMRATAQVLIYLDVEKAMADRMKVYISANNVVLIEGPVSAKYFKKVVRKIPHKEVLLSPPSQQPSQLPSQQPFHPPIIFGTFSPSFYNVLVEIQWFYMEGPIFIGPCCILQCKKLYKDVG